MMEANESLAFRHSVDIYYGNFKWFPFQKMSLLFGTFSSLFWVWVEDEVEIFLPC